MRKTEKNGSISKDNIMICITLLCLLGTTISEIAVLYLNTLMKGLQ